MAEINGPNLTLINLFSGTVSSHPLYQPFTVLNGSTPVPRLGVRTRWLYLAKHLLKLHSDKLWNKLTPKSLCFLIYHTYKFDKCRCLVPSRKEWFRVLLTWMLLLSNICLSVWAAGWCCECLFCPYLTRVTSSNPPSLVPLSLPLVSYAMAYSALTPRCQVSTRLGAPWPIRRPSMALGSLPRAVRSV